MEKLTKKQQIIKLKEGDFVDDIFVIKIKKSMIPYANGYSFALILSDSSGASIEYKYWGGTDENKVRKLFLSIKSDSVVRVAGKINSYNGKLQISGDEFTILNVLNPGEYDAEFISPPQRNPEEMYSMLLSKINSVFNIEIKNLLLKIFEGDLKEKFLIHPGAIQIHHNWKSGLLQHVLEIIEYCETSVSLFKGLDRDLLIAGAVLHDIGKLEEIEVTSRIKGTQKGQLISHLVLGTNYVSEKLKQSNISEIIKDKLMHMIVSHHGKTELGSPKPPMFPEALVLYYADEMSSKVSEMIEFIKEARKNTEDDFMYDSKKGTNIFLR